jgi:beta-lactamase class D
MKKIIFFLGAFLLFCQTALRDSKCFLAKEDNKVIKEEGDCSTSWAPQSTFKIPLSLIGFDSNILKSENDPSWSLPDGADPYINVCKGAHTPRTWMRDSCLWYSRILTTKLGMEKFQNYVSKFAYGNMDISGGLTDAWISSSLKISPKEQVRFLQNFIDRKLPVVDKAYQMTKNIMFIQEMAGGWKLYGKTGNGKQFDKDGNKTELQHGWFVGFIQKNEKTIVFASHIADDKKEDVFASFRVKNEALNKLYYLINNLEK